MASFDRGRSAATAVAALGAAAPSVVFAHAPVEGVEGFYVGIVHPLSTPDQLLALLGLGVMLGLRWPAGFGRIWAVFLLAMLAGVAWGQLSGLPLWASTALLLVAIVTTTLAALLPAGIQAASLALAGLVGGLIGVLSTPEPGPLPATIFTIAGSVVGANLALFYVSAGIGALRRKFDQPWFLIGVRVLAAWIGAVSIILIALATAQA
ncbi:MAG: HupE/UreJ family protein [Pseudomonadota bacterium]